MSKDTDRESQFDAARRRMLAFTTLSEQLALADDPAATAMQLLACLHDDIEGLAAYRMMKDGSVTLLLHAGCARAPPAHAASARDIGCPDWATLAGLDEAARILDPGHGGLAWIGADASPVAAIPAGGRAPEDPRGLVLFLLKPADRTPSLMALLDLSAHRIFQALMRDGGSGRAQAGRPAARTQVLLIDDEDLLVAHVKRILERAGFAFHASDSARGGFRLAARIQPDVVLIDKVLPDLDGIELLRMMRRDELLSTVPVIMLSGQADESARVAALGEGADDFVAKPFSAKDLVARIEANVRLVRLRRDTIWRQGELLRLRQSQQELRTLLDTVQRVRADERRMLAREVHDQLGQILTAARIEIRLLQERLRNPDGQPPPERIAADLGAALSSIDLATLAVQDITALLRPPALEEGGLVAALRWQAADLRRRTRIDCVVLHDPEGYVEQPPFVAGELLRMCQEALTNVLRHAGATRIIIQVGMRNACLRIRICDNGGGIPRARLHDPASLGLKGMRERAASIRASVHVYGRRGRGTMVAIRRRLAFL